ncbi:MAG: hypothetical protein LC623_08210 [Halobacteriales archaeon]|nr:hypothetical protein [Halobacteriales archaeon]
MFARNLAIIAACATLVATLTPLVPQTQAQAAVLWHHELVNGVNDVTRTFQLASNGEELGFLWKVYTGAPQTGLVGFSIRTPGCTGDTCWIGKTTDISGTGNDNLVINRLLATGTGTWLAMTHDYAVAKGKLWKTVDNGATWTLLFTQSGTCGPTTDGGIYDVASGNGFQILVTSCGDTISSPDYWEYDGSTWYGPIPIGDNLGVGSTISGATSNAAAMNGGSTIMPDGEVIWARSSGGNVGIYTAHGARQFWSVAYGTGDCSNFEQVYQNLGTILCPIFGNAATNLQAIWTPSGHIIHGWARNGKSESFFYSYGGAYRIPLIYPTTPALTPDTMVTLSGTTPGTCASGFIGGSTRLAITMNAADMALNAYSCTSGNPGGLVIQYRDYKCLVGVCQGWVQSHRQSITSRDIAVAMTDTKSYVVYTNSSVGDRAELLWAITPISTLASDAPVAQVDVSGIVGFDVDPMDRVVIARTTPQPSAIRVYDPATLTLQGASPLATGCNKLDGVLAYSQDPPGRGYTAYLNCTVTATQANLFSIRNELLGNPDQTGTVCTDFCDFDLQTQDGGSVCPGTTSKTLPGGIQQIGNIVAAPISWENGQAGSFLSQATALVAFAFSDVGNGNVGLWAILQYNNQGDESCGTSVAFSAPGQTRQLCTWRATDGNDYLTAVSDTVPGKVWRIKIGPAPDVVRGGSSQPIVELVQVYTYQSPYDKAKAVACGGDYVALFTPTGTVAMVRVLNGTLGTLKWPPIVGATPYTRGIAMSRDVLWLGFTDSATTVRFVGANNGTTIHTIKMPANGTFAALRIDDTARSAYIATQGFPGTIARYDLAATAKFGNQPLGTRTDADGNTVCVGSDGNPYDCSGGGKKPTNPDASATASRQLWWFVGITAGFAFAAWGLTGGRVQRHHGRMPDIIPGSTPVIVGAAYVGMWVAVLWKASDYWYVPTLLAVVALGFVVWGTSRRSGFGG